MTLTDIINYSTTNDSPSNPGKSTTTNTPSPANASPTCTAMDSVSAWPPPAARKRPAPTDRAGFCRSAVAWHDTRPPEPTGGAHEGYPETNSHAAATGRPRPGGGGGGGAGGSAAAARRAHLLRDVRSAAHTGATVVPRASPRACRCSPWFVSARTTPAAPTQARRRARRRPMSRRQRPARDTSTETKLRPVSVPLGRAAHTYLCHVTAQ